MEMGLLVSLEKKKKKVWKPNLSDGGGWEDHWEDGITIRELRGGIGP